MPIDSRQRARRRQALSAQGASHPHPEAVADPLFRDSAFFDPNDLVQVKYEMLRAHAVDRLPVSEAAVAHGYSRAAFYLVLASFSESGMAGLLDEPRGRRGPVKLRPEIVTFIRESPAGPAELVERVADRYGVRLHRRTIERARRR